MIQHLLVLNRLLHEKSLISTSTPSIFGWMEIETQSNLTDLFTDCKKIKLKKYAIELILRKQKSLLLYQGAIGTSTIQT